MLSIDIILFCYNQEQYIEQALRSIYEQDMPKGVTARIIVADDCSLDKTLSIIKCLEHESPFPMVFLPEEPNMGISKNYKRSFVAIEADYVFILEGDDYWLPNHIAQHILFWQQHKKCSMAMSKLTFMNVDAEGIETLEPAVEWRYPADPFMVDLRMQIVEGNQLGNLSACSFKGNYLRSLPANLFDMPIADWMLGVMMAEYEPIALMAESSSVYRVKASGVWAGQSRWKQHIIMLRDADKYDHFQNYKYHTFWHLFKQSCWRDVRRNWMRYMPQWVQNLWHKIKK